MTHLLLTESWVGAMSSLLPRAITAAGHEFTFLTRDLGHYLAPGPHRPAGRHPLLGARHILTAETNDPEVIAGFALQAHQLLGFDGVLTSCDYYLDTAAVIAQRLGLPGAGPETVRRGRRKDLARLATRDLGPRFEIAASWGEARAGAAALGYPLVVKPVDLCAGMFVRLVRDEAGLREAYGALAAFPVNARQQERCPVVLLEEYLTGAEVSVETVTVDGRTTVVGVTSKVLAGEPYFVEAAHEFPAPGEHGEAVRVAVAAIGALGITHGVCHVEVRGGRLVEVNLRPAGNYITELVRLVTGIDLAAVQVQLALGETPDLTPRATGHASAAIRFFVPDATGTVRAVHSAGRPDGVEDWRLADMTGRDVRPATSNNDYYGHVITAGADAAARAEALVPRLEYR
ncbi:ATP-grasp domain-containing protein [Longispora albida]|uniref:ATP-grasp domain-containing protein n=1 Tax=Longispora albida TaxID=203523 RepID=UPI000363C3CE|nr:ATP-grasp domain-containing protein [Longispora albida]